MRGGVVTRDEALERIRGMLALLKAQGLRGPFVLAVRPSTLREWGGLPAGALPADVTVEEVDWLPPNEVRLIDEDAYADTEEAWQDFLSTPEP